MQSDGPIRPKKSKRIQIIAEKSISPDYFQHEEVLPLFSKDSSSRKTSKFSTISPLNIKSGVTSKEMAVARTTSKKNNTNKIMKYYN